MASPPYSPSWATRLLEAFDVAERRPPFDVAEQRPPLDIAEQRRAPFDIAERPLGVQLPRARRNQVLPAQRGGNDAAAAAEPGPEPGDAGVGAGRVREDDAGRAVGDADD